MILKVRGDPDGALALFKEKELLYREFDDKHGLQALLGNQAVILQIRGDLEGAMALLEEQERLCREIGNPEGLPVSPANQAEMLSSAPGRRREARRLADEAHPRLHPVERTMRNRPMPTANQPRQPAMTRAIGRWDNWSDDLTGSVL